MSRALWFVGGAASGVYTLVKAKRAAQQFTPDGIAARAAALAAGARVFADEVSAGMREREAELRAELHAQRRQLRSVEGSTPRRLLPSPPRQHESAHPAASGTALPSPEGSEDGHR
ncbi:MAG: hypothetical protein H0T14_00645 [Nocardioidaceae bacterium]|nr:hypothetical protein [Nocardioidaceae bacterium]